MRATLKTDCCENENRTYKEYVFNVLMHKLGLLLSFWFCFCIQLLFPLFTEICRRCEYEQDNQMCTQIQKNIYNVEHNFGNRRQTINMRYIRVSSQLKGVLKNVFIFVSFLFISFTAIRTSHTYNQYMHKVSEVCMHIIRHKYTCTYHAIGCCFNGFILFSS